MRRDLLDVTLVAARGDHRLDAGTLRGELPLSSPNGESTSFVAPRVQQPETVHIILQLEDRGTPSLFAYRRAVITIEP
mgnify:CR=1 FL=1